MSVETGIAHPVCTPRPFHPHTGKEIQQLRMMMLIRRLEERTYIEYTKPGQKIGGFCHLYSGQEAIAVGTASLFDKDRDYLINGYRCHGHSLALGMSPRVVMAELFGKRTGCSKGKGGSMHLFDASVGNNGGHGIVGGQIPLGIGMAFAQQYKGTGGVTFTFMGDGAINQGSHNEALNLASLYKLPVIFVVENNGVAMGTQVGTQYSAEKDLGDAAAPATTCPTGMSTATTSTPSSANSAKPSSAAAPARAPVSSLPTPTASAATRCPMR